MNNLTGYKASLSPWIENLSFEWGTLPLIGKKINLEKHSPIFRQGDRIESVYIIESGRVRLYMTSPLGDEKAIAIIGKNGLIGECGIFGDSFYHSSAITASKTSLVKIPASLFKEALRINFTLMEQVFFLMDLKLKILSFHTMQLSFYSATQRIGHTLLQLAYTYGKKIGQRYLITISFTHQELANLVGTSRVTVANTMKGLENSGILSKQDGKYTIENPDLLELYVVTDEL